MTVGHEEKQRFEKYEFPCQIVFDVEFNEKTREELLRIWKQTMYPSPHRVLYSPYGNPYECHLSQHVHIQPSHELKDGDIHCSLTCRGYAHRRRDLKSLRHKRHSTQEEVCVCVCVCMCVLRRGFIVIDADSRHRCAGDSFTFRHISLSYMLEGTRTYIHTYIHTHTH